MNPSNAILIIAEHREGHIHPVTYELMNKAKQLSEVKNNPVQVLLLGDLVEQLAKNLSHYECDGVFYIQNPQLSTYNTDAYTHCVTTFIKENHPEIVLIGATAQGRDLAPRIAARNKTGLTADCTALEMDENGTFLMTRPAFGGNLMATITCENHIPRMSTVRPGVFAKGQRSDTTYCEPVKKEIDFSDIAIRGRLLETIKEKKQTANISESNVLIAGGRGMGGKKGFELLQKLAELMGGTIAASRPVIDQGWVDKAYQVGQTGKTVRPRLYIACGISGALQHIAGMQESDFIIAINKNEDAPIMKIADLAIVGDVHKIIPEMIARLES